MLKSLISYIKKIARHILPPSIARTNREIETLRSGLYQENKRLQNKLDALEHHVDNLHQQSKKQSIQLNQKFDQRNNQEKQRINEILNGIQTLKQFQFMNIRPCENAPIAKGCVVSVASYKKRIKQIAPMLASVLAQTVLPELIVLCLPLDDFPRRYLDLPDDVRWLLGSFNYQVHWVERDLGPHNKYFSTMQQYPDCCVITLDDDTCYQPNLIETLWNTHKRFPDCVIAPRTHICKFDEAGAILPYMEWELEQLSIINEPSAKLVPTGLGGVLYPPHALPKCAFDESTILETCKNADDLWLKIMTASNRVKVVNPDYIFAPYHVANSQQNSLYKTNKDLGGNDAVLKVFASLQNESVNEGIRWMFLN